MTNLLNEALEDAKKVKEAALKSAEFLVREKLASEYKDNYLKLLFEGDSKNEDEYDDEIEEIEEVEESEEVSDENVQKNKKIDKSCKTSKVAPNEGDDKMIINDEVDKDDDLELFESFGDLFESEDMKILNEAEEDQQEEQPVESEQAETSEEDSQQEEDDEDLEFDLSDMSEGDEGADMADGGSEMEDPVTDSSTDGIADNPAEPKEDVQQIAVNKFPFSYNRDTFKVDGRENKNKKSKIKLQPQYEEDSELNPNNIFSFDELEESDDEDGENEQYRDHKTATQKTPKKQVDLVEESINTEELVRIPSSLMLEYMEKDLQQVSNIKKLENQIKTLKEQVAARERTIETYAIQLQESNKFLVESIKVQYKYKALSDDSLSERQKKVICEQLDKHDNIDTIGKIFETLRRSVSVGKNPNESLAGLGNKNTKSTIFLKEQKERMNQDYNDFTFRLKELAGIRD